ncbi:MAG: N-acetyltransferase [Kiloniellaceae bacterium]
MLIREATAADLPDILNIHSQAFSNDKEAELVRTILADPSAQPTVSILASDEARPVGHILFSKARLTEPDSSCSVIILAPLAVIPEAQGKSFGGGLIKSGLQLLAAQDVDLVFVLGQPSYYGRYGFEPAGRLGLDPPHRLPQKHADAWMVRALKAGLLGTLRGTVVCSDELNKPALWRP